MIGHAHPRRLPGILLVASLAAACGGTTEGGGPDSDGASFADSQAEDFEVEAEASDAAVGDAVATDAETSVDVPVEEGPRTPAVLLVYTSNIENLEEPDDRCPGDWRDFFSCLALQDAKPDLILFQQISDQAQLDFILRRLENMLGENYAGIIAEADPVPFNSPCGVQREQQTNAIVYRVGRLARAGAKHVFRSYKKKDGSCVRDNLSRTRTLMQALVDRETGLRIAVGCIHWSTNQEPGADRACALRNVRETDQVLRERYPDAALYIFGGDTNEPELRDSTDTCDYWPWYPEVNGELGGPLGYRDPIYDRCMRAGNLKRCLHDNWTTSSTEGRRIDFLFAGLPDRGLPDTSWAHTVTFDEADAADRELWGDDDPQNYSDHRAVRARFHY